MSVRSNWDTKSSSKTKISEFERSIAVDEKVLWLQISVQSAMRMTERNTLQQLLHVRANQHWFQVSAHTVENEGDGDGNGDGDGDGDGRRR